VSGGPRAGLHLITLRNRGGARFDCGSTDTILDAAEDAGHVLPYGCRYGGCITCAAKLVSGAVEQIEAVGLKPAQVAAGFVLLCVARPLCDCVIDAGVESHEGLYRNPFRDG
jgi:ferredoxin